MAIQTGRWRPAAGGAEVVTEPSPPSPGVPASTAGAFRPAGCSSRRRLGRDLYQFLTYGPLIRLVAKTLLRRIIFANLIGLAILLSGVFYLAQYRAGLIEAQRDGLKVQGESFASLIAFNATREEGTGRIVLNRTCCPRSRVCRSFCATSDRRPAAPHTPG